MKTLKTIKKIDNLRNIPDRYKKAGLNLFVSYDQYMENKKEVRKIAKWDGSNWIVKGENWEDKINKAIEFWKKPAAAEIKENERIDCGIQYPDADIAKKHNIALGKVKIMTKEGRTVYGEEYVESEKSK